MHTPAQNHRTTGFVTRKAESRVTMFACKSHLPTVANLCKIEKWNPLVTIPRFCRTILYDTIKIGISHTNLNQWAFGLILW